VTSVSVTAPKRVTHPLRVLHVYRTYLPDPTGGLQEAIRQICLNTSALGVESRIFTLSPNVKPRLIRRDEADVYRCPRHFEIASSGFSLSALGTFRELIRWADVVNYHFPWPFADLLHVLGRVAKPSLVTYHSDIVRQLGLRLIYKPLMYHFLGAVDRIVATSPNYRRSSVVLRRYAKKVEVISLALDETSYPQPDYRVAREMQERFGRDFFLFIGVLRYYKGLSYLLEAVHGTGLKVVIAGSGPLGSQLRKQASELGLENVHFLGQVRDDQKVSLIRLSKGIVFPSCERSEAFGVTLLEGAMFGKPLISTELGTGTTYVNQDKKTGLVVPPADPLRLREAMLCLDKDRDLATRLGSAARERFEELFTGTGMGERYFRLYRTLIDR